MEAVRLVHAAQDARPVGVAREVAREVAWWNSDRLDTTALDGASIFVLDTGVDTKSSELAEVGRFARNVASFVEGEEWDYMEAWGWGDHSFPTAADGEALLNNDVHGHGTRTAEMCCGATLGRAPLANVYGVKILDDSGTGTADWGLAAIDAVAGLVQRAVLGEGAVVVFASLGDYADTDLVSLAVKSLEALGARPG